MAIGIGMILAGIVGVLCGLKNEQVKKYDILAIIFLFMGILSCISVFSQGKKDGNPIYEGIKKNEAGEGEIKKKFLISVPGLITDYPYQLTVPERKLTEKEVDGFLAAAKKEIKSTFCNDSPSFQQIRSQVTIRDLYQNGIVSADWHFEPDEVVGQNGILNSNEIPKDGLRILAIADLSCQDKVKRYKFDFRVLPEQYTKEEIILRQIKEALNKEMKEHAEKKVFLLPDQVKGKKIKWKETGEKMPQTYFLLSVIACISVLAAQQMEKQKKEENRRQQMLLDYPDFVSKFSLLLGSGMTVIAAWEKMANSYVKQKKAYGGFEHAVYEEVLVTIHQLQSGMGEFSAFTQFGERCGLQAYRKLASLIVQNQKMGAKRLNDMLGKEIETALSERKNLARKRGEEAGTKLVLPMTVMLLLVMFIIMVPAFLNIKI